MKKFFYTACTLTLFALTLTNDHLFGQQTTAGASASSHASQVSTPIQEPPAGLVKIFGNLGPKTSAFTSGGWFVVGPKHSGGRQFVGLPFSPKANSTVTQVQAAVQYNASGANQVNLSVYTDNGGAPGTLIGGPVTITNLSNCCVCCTLTIGSFSPGVHVVAGAKYWLVADTPASGTGSDFLGVWNWTPPTTTRFGLNHTGWVSSGAVLQEPAGALYGTVP